MADKLKYASGNSSSTTLSSGVADNETSAPLTSDTNFNAKSGEGMVIVSEGENVEEFAYATGKSGGALTIPLANRGLEGGSAQTHPSGATVKGIITSGMWNDAIDSLAKIVDKTTGEVPGTSVLDEDTLASNSATALATQQSIKAYVDGRASEDGWRTAGITGATVTRQSTDNPTVVLRFDADVTDYIWKGMRIKATENSIVHYFIVSADPVYSAPNTDVTCLSEIDTATPTQAKNLIGATAISAVAYAPPKTYPKGFPIFKNSWAVRRTSTAQVSQGSPTQNTWYNLDSSSIPVPIGEWEYAYRAVVRCDVTSPTTQATLSTANNSSSDAETLTGFTTSGPTAVNNLHVMTSRRVVLTTKETRFLNIRTVTASATRVDIRGDFGTTMIEATSTLL